MVFHALLMQNQIKNPLPNKQVSIPLVCARRKTYRSSCFCALWMQMEGKLHSTSSLFSSLALATDLTKMTTYTLHKG